MEVVLVNDVTKKKALLYNRKRAMFSIYPPETQYGQKTLRDPIGRKLVRDLCFHFRPWLDFYDHLEENVPRVQPFFSLCAHTPLGVSEEDFSHLFKYSLEWF